MAVIFEKANQTLSHSEVGWTSSLHHSLQLLVGFRVYILGHYHKLNSKISACIWNISGKKYMLTSKYNILKDLLCRTDKGSFII